SGRTTQDSSSQALPAQLRGVRVVRDGQVVKQPSGGVVERDARTTRQDIRGPLRDLKVGDRVRLLSFGSVGIVNHIKDDEAEVRVGSLRMREKLDDLELVFEVRARGNEVSTSRGSDRGSSPTVRKGALETVRRRA